MPARPTVGRPYFVMELVKGVPITEYCDEQQSARSRERLELFLPRLPGGAARPSEGDHPPRPQAVERAGRRCTTTRPVPKVIDFGVAKAIGAAADREDAVHGASAQMIGTPST